MKNLKLLSMLLMMAMMSFSFTSCGSDDDGDGGGSESGAPYTGVWKVTHIEVVDDDGERYGGNVPGNYIEKMTIYENGTFEYYSYIPEDEEEEEEDAEEFTCQGDWDYNPTTETLTFRSVNDNGFTYGGEQKILQWNAAKLVTYYNDGYGSQTRTWMRQ